jgi:hypothetical protein
VLAGAAGVTQLTTLLPPGATTVITATYAGDGNFLGGTLSNSASVVVPLDLTFTNARTAAYTAALGAMANNDFALAPLYGSYPGTVIFTVMGLTVGVTMPWSVPNF